MPIVNNIDNDILKHQPILFFDGLCTLCNGAVQFVLKHEEKPGVLNFASLQSALGQTMLQKAFGANPPDSLVLIANNTIYTKSEAAIKLAEYLKQPYSWAKALGILPSVLNNAVYNLVAKTRYSLFGKQATCTLPQTEYINRFFN